MYLADIVTPRPVVEEKIEVLFLTLVKSKSNKSPIQFVSSISKSELGEGGGGLGYQEKKNKN
jgi:hypothetical protein